MQTSAAECIEFMKDLQQPKPSFRQVGPSVGPEARNLFEAKRKCKNYTKKRWFRNLTVDVLATIMAVRADLQLKV